MLLLDRDGVDDLRVSQTLPYRSAGEDLAQQDSIGVHVCRLRPRKFMIARLCGSYKQRICRLKSLKSSAAETWACQSG